MSRTWAASLSSAALLLWANSAAAASLVPRGKPITIRADLDGDGRPETASITFFGNDERSIGHFQVIVGRDTLFQFGESIEDTARIVDIDTTDSFREIAIQEDGPSDDYAVYFVRYTRMHLRLVGFVPGTLNDDMRVDGSGAIRTECRGTILCTWWYPCFYRLYEESGALGEVPQAFMPMNVQVTLKRDLPLFASPVDRRIRGRIRQGEQATIDLTDDRQWARIRSKSGLVGWFWIREWKVFIGYNDVDIQDVFDGLPMAD